MTVWIVYTEYQNGDPSIDGLYELEADAVRAREQTIDYLIRELHKDVYDVQTCTGCGLRVCAESCGKQDYEEPADWDVDVHIAKHDVHLASTSAGTRVLTDGGTEPCPS